MSDISGTEELVSCTFLDTIDNDMLIHVADFIKELFPPLADVYTYHGDDPILRALLERDLGRLLQFLCRKARDAQYYSGEDALRDAVLVKSEATVESLLRNGTPIDTDILKLVAALGTPECLRLFIEISKERLLPLSLDQDLSQSGSMLNIAAYFRNTPVVVELLRLGADLEHRNSYGDTPLLCAARNFQWDAYRTYDYSEHLHSAAMTERVLEALRDKGASPHARSNDGTGLFSYIFESLRTDLFKDPRNQLLSVILVEGRYRPDDRNGLSNAILTGYIKEYAQNEDARSPTGLSIIDYHDKTTKLTPLMLTLRRGYTDVGLKLLDSGANPHIRDSRGRTTLMAATENCFSVIVYQLLDLKVDVNARDADGNTALMLAAKRDVFYAPHILLALLRHGANPLLRNNDGHDALECALQHARDWTPDDDYNDCGSSRCVVELIRAMLPIDASLRRRMMALVGGTSSPPLLTNSLLPETCILGSLFDMDRD